MKSKNSHPKSIANFSDPQPLIGDELINAHIHNDLFNVGVYAKLETNSFINEIARRESRQG